MFRYVHTNIDVKDNYNADHPTLEIFQYDEMKASNSPQINRCGIAHLAFEVEIMSKKP